MLGVQYAVCSMQCVKGPSLRAAGPGRGHLPHGDGPAQLRADRGAEARDAVPGAGARADRGGVRPLQHAGRLQHQPAEYVPLLYSLPLLFYPSLLSPPLLSFSPPSLYPAHIIPVLFSRLDEALAAFDDARLCE